MKKKARKVREWWMVIATEDDLVISSFNNPASARKERGKCILMFPCKIIKVREVLPKRKVKK